MIEEIKLWAASFFSLPIAPTGGKHATTFLP
jgi:hypothetical protein